MIFLLNLIFKILLLSSLSEAIVDRLRWNNSAIKQKNRKPLDQKIMKNYVDVVSEQLINTLVKFLKKLCQINMNIFEAHIYWNFSKVSSSITFAILKSTALKSDALKSDFFDFRSLEKLRQNIFAESFRQSVRRFFSRYLKNIQALKKKKTIQSTSFLN